MRIEKVALRNYRQLRDVELVFERNSPNDLHIIIGRNGTGKTNLLNAINWCLYGDEPHLSRHSEQLPRLNLGCIEQADGSGNQDLAVEIWVKTRDDGYLIFERRETYSVGGEDRRPLLRDSHFEARVTDDKGNTKILVDDEASYCADRFVPRRIREFFFFDGERLDRYFKEATAQHIRHAVFELSQIHVLERVLDRLETVLKDLRREAGKASPAIEEARSELDDVEEKLADIEDQIETCLEQISLAKDKIAAYEEQLRGVPDAAALEDERKNLERRRKQKQEVRDDRLKDKHDLLFEYGIGIGLWSAVARSLRIIEDKRQRKEIPPTVDTALLEAVLEDEVCSVCGRLLDESCARHVRTVLDKIRLSSDIANELLKMETPLRHYAEKLGHFQADMRRLTREIEGHEDDLATIQARRDEIDAELDGYDVERIAEWHRERSQFEATRDTNQRKLGSLELRRAGLLEQVRVARKRLDQEVNKEAKVGALRSQMDFCADALDSVSNAKQMIMSDTRQEIESDTRTLFFDLAWKSATFGDITIHEDFSVSLIHSMGYQCLGTASAAERELLALSFTLALHKVSGFDSPILIDTPVARVSDRHRVRFGEVLLQVSADKQTVLLFTPAEHSEDLAQVLDRRSSNTFVLKLSSDETEASLEVLHNGYSDR